jgi:ketosteroid isomerase-like protein
MRHLIPFYLAALAIYFKANPALAQSNTKANDKTVSWLSQFRTSLIKSKADKKPQSIQTYYSNDIRLMPEFQKTIIGKENISIYEKEFLNRFDVVDYTRIENEIIDLGTRVIEIGSFTEKLRQTETKQLQDVRGKYIDVWIRENDDLTLNTQAWNYDHPLTEEDQLKFDNVPFTNVALQSHLPINNSVSFELAALNRLMEKTISEHDEKIWLQFYADDGSFLYSRTPAVKGKSALSTFLSQHVKAMPIFEKLDVRNDRIDDLGNYVIEYASHIAIIRNGDFSGVFTGKDLAIWRREPNGSLKIFRHIGMYD